MTRKPVKSSQLLSVGHDPETSTLEVEFHPTRKQAADSQLGSVYQYANVSAADHAALVGAESVGSHFIQVIKKQPEKYPYKKIE